jgi:hypothetical protein
MISNMDIYISDKMPLKKLKIRNCFLGQKMGCPKYLSFYLFIFFLGAFFRRFVYTLEIST